MAWRKTYHVNSSANSINSVRTKFKLNLTKAKAKNPFPISLTLQIYYKDPNRKKTTFKSRIEWEGCDVKIRYELTKNYHD